MSLDISQFSGGDDRYEHVTKRLIYTEGVKYVADEAGAYWLIDAIASYQTRELDERTRGFQCWTLAVNRKESTAVLVCDDGDGNVAVTQAIEYTDFPDEEIKMYVANGTLMLPSEY